MFKIAELLEVTKAKLIQGNQNLVVRGISIDSRTIKPGEAFIALKGANFDGHDFIREAIKKGASCIIQETAAAKPQQRKGAFIEVADTVKALGNIALFWRKKFDLPLIAITGSNGKTSTKEMVAWVLAQRFKVLKNEGTQNNQFGLPLTLLKLNNFFDAAVLELGTNHFGEIEYLAKICQPNIGIITNIGPAHLEYFGSLSGTFREKYSLVKNLAPPGLAILNADDPLLRRKLSKKIHPQMTLGVGIDNKADFFASDIKLILPRRRGSKISPGKLEFLVNRKYEFTLGAIGYYNIYNALIATAVGYIFGISYEEIKSRLKTFVFPKGRLNFLTFKDINFIDDTYNSNPASLKQALDALNNFSKRGRKIFVMGDMLELGRRTEFFHHQAGRQAAKICDILIAVGKFSKMTAEAARATGLGAANIFLCSSSKMARDILWNKISPRKNDIVLVKGSRLMKMEEVLRS